MPKKHVKGCPRLDEALSALRPFAFFAWQDERQPLGHSGEDIYGIHPGTPWEATLRRRDCRRALRILKQHGVKFRAPRRHA